MLHGYLELKILAPEIENWTEERLAINPPRLYRAMMLQAMLRAFGVEDFVSFREGSFIEGNSTRYAHALTLISRGKLSAAPHSSLQESFTTILRHREEVDSVICFGCGAYSVGTTLQQETYRRIWDFSRAMKAEIIPIDDILTAIISPEQKSLSVKDLVSEYQFPEVDISEIDLDWL